LQIIKQVKKLIYVKDVSDITAMPYVARELMLVKVRTVPQFFLTNLLGGG
jgi:acetolactate synthase small subunit